MQRSLNILEVGESLFESWRRILHHGKWCFYYCHTHFIFDCTRLVELHYFCWIVLGRIFIYGVFIHNQRRFVFAFRFLKIYYTCFWFLHLCKILTLVTQKAACQFEILKVLIWAFNQFSWRNLIFFNSVRWNHIASILIRSCIKRVIKFISYVVSCIIYMKIMLISRFFSVTFAMADLSQVLFIIKNVIFVCNEISSIWQTILRQKLKRGIVLHVNFVKWTFVSKNVTRNRFTTVNYPQLFRRNSIVGFLMRHIFLLLFSFLNRWHLSFTGNENTTVTVLAWKSTYWVLFIVLIALPSETSAKFIEFLWSCRIFLFRDVWKQFTDPASVFSALSKQIFPNCSLTLYLWGKIRWN